MHTKKIIIAGGGTGGHIFPAIAIANAIKALAPDTQFLFVGANGKMEMEKVPQAGYAIKGIDIAGFNRSSLLKNIGLPYKLAKSFLQVKSIIKAFQPNAVIGVGGYSTFPVLRYAQAKKIPTFIHESNSFAGKANMLLGKKATKIFVASSGMEKFFPADKIFVSGNPVRSSIVHNQLTQKEAVQFFNLSEHKKTILSIGGSLGAKSINTAIEEQIAVFEKNNIQLIWQTGKPYADAAAQVSKPYANVYTSAFIKEMEYAFAAADLVISRAGAMAIAELCTIGKPAILVPYPFAAEDHQTANAQYLVKNKAALMVPDAAVKETLINTLLELLSNEQEQEQLKNNIKAFATPEADTVVAKEILKYI
jgi:UDP-N-acetylglucosamine--N-acetylmuramyl-(pentapeptide) pyrophosphoryl-undecaprenol N-acetylglucosamine transferase